MVENCEGEVVRDQCEVVGAELLVLGEDCAE